MFKELKAPLVPTVILLGEITLANSKWAADWLVGLLLGFTVFWLLCSLLSSKAIMRKFPWLHEWAPFLDPTGLGLAASQLQGHYISKKTFRLVDVSVDGKIYDRTFEDCVIYGPAVVAASGYQNHYNCEYVARTSVDQINWLLDQEIQAGKTSLDAVPEGAIVVENCAFKRCRFVKVGFLATKESAAEFARTVNKKTEERRSEQPRD